MFDSALDKLSERLPHNAPGVVSMVLIALIAAELVHDVRSLAHASAASRAAPLRMAPGLPAREGANVKEIVAAHLFGVATVDRGALDAQEPVPSTGPLVLAGTIATGDPNDGMAIIGGEDAGSKVYAVGQSVGGALLHAVYLDHVLLNRDGILESLSLRKLLAAAKVPPRLPPRPVAVAAAAEDTASSDAPRALSDLVRLTPTLWNGAPGYRVTGGVDNHSLQASGLRPGDVMTAINGAPLLDSDSAQRSLDQLKSGHAMVTVMRRGRPANIDVDFSQ
jgi:type II secretion system protein C